MCDTVIYNRMFCIICICKRKCGKEDTLTLNACTLIPANKSMRCRYFEKLEMIIDNSFRIPKQTISLLILSFVSVFNLLMAWPFDPAVR